MGDLYLLPLCLLLRVSQQKQFVSAGSGSSGGCSLLSKITMKLVLISLLPLIGVSVFNTYYLITQLGLIFTLLLPIFISQLRLSCLLFYHLKTRSSNEARMVPIGKAFQKTGSRVVACHNTVFSIATGKPDFDLVSSFSSRLNAQTDRLVLKD